MRPFIQRQQPIWLEMIMVRNHQFSLEGWTRGKNFLTSDILEFIYDEQLFNVVVVDKKGHDTCTVNDGAMEFDSGDDKIPLAFGANYFICSTQPDLCAAIIKMAINATTPPPSSK
ncbi:hypothetical protein QUC31_010612 [Theobroma cacao]